METVSGSDLRCGLNLSWVLLQEVSRSSGSSDSSQLSDGTATRNQESVYGPDTESESVRLTSASLRKCLTILERFE